MALSQVSNGKVNHRLTRENSMQLKIIHIISTVSAIVACLRFCHVLADKLRGHRPMAKLFAFKMLVGLNIVINVSSIGPFASPEPAPCLPLFAIKSLPQPLKESSQIVFNIVEGLDPSPLEPDSTMSEADVVVGAHALLNCIIMVGFSIFFHYAYSVTPYLIGKEGDSETGCRSEERHYRGGFLGVHAWVGMFNPMEIIGAAASIFKSGVSPGRTTVIEGVSDGQKLMRADLYEMSDRGRLEGDKRGVGQSSP